MCLLILVFGWLVLFDRFVSFYVCVCACVLVSSRGMSSGGKRMVSCRFYVRALLFSVYAHTVSRSLSFSLTQLQLLLIEIIEEPKKDNNNEHKFEIPNRVAM